MKDQTFSELDTVKIALDLLGALKDMSKIGAGMNHRNIQPGSIILTPLEDGYRADLVNMETVKIEGAATTVFGIIDDQFSDSPYIHPLVRKGNATQETPWEKVDVYAIAKLMVRLRDPKAVKETVDIDTLYYLFNDDLAGLLMDVLENSLNLIPQQENFRRSLENVLGKLE